MLIVFFADKPGAEYEDLLDVLFLSSGLLNPLELTATGKPKLGNLSDGATGFLRAGLCLILEEILLTLEAGLAKLGDRPEVPKYFQKEEVHEVDPDPGAPNPLKGELTHLKSICPFFCNAPNNLLRIKNKSRVKSNYELT